MNRKRNFIKPGGVIIDTSPQIRMSELIGEYALDYINMGNSTKERQNYLNGACTAWNIAVIPEGAREAAIRRAVDGYRRNNPGVADVDVFEQNLRTLIRKKLDMFPSIKKLIVDAVIEPITETKYRINVVSTYDRDLLKRYLGRGLQNKNP